MGDIGLAGDYLGGCSWSARHLSLQEVHGGKERGEEREEGILGAVSPGPLRGGSRMAGIRAAYLEFAHLPFLPSFTLFPCF